MDDQQDSDVGEHALGEIQGFLVKAQSLSLESVKEIAEQFHVQAILAKATPRRRKIFEALGDYFEHAHETRTKAEGRDDHEDGIGAAVRALLDNFDNDSD
ncbi:MAG: hypothetical protein HOJ90_02560 [Alphaproteobacteria bacterium]|jgi:hypothetical protein|nr:hypothetical protein [Alphaproteobacteria bacterium]